MKKLYVIAKQLLLLLFCFISYTAVGQTLTIDQGPITLDPYADTMVSAVFTDSSGITHDDARIKWHTEPGYLGKVIKNDDILVANHPGEGWLIAKYKDLRDSVELKVNGTPKNDDDDDEMEEDDDDYPKVKIIPGHIRVEVSDSVELRALYIDTAGVKIDTTLMWSVDTDMLGYFPDPEDPMFYSFEMTGTGMIMATLGDLADTVKLTVYESKAKKHQKNKNNRGKQITITPDDMMVYAEHGSITYEAELKSNGQKHQDPVFVWSLSDSSIAEISPDGEVTLTGETGMTLVNARYGNFMASVELLVVDSTVDMEINTISIMRVMPNGNELKPKTLKEGESYKIGGLPFPLNILNGGMLHFPYGCIDEDIEIYMFIPEEYAEICDTCTEVTFTDDIITGVKFSVQPFGSDTIVEPYFFNKHVNLCMVFKHGLFDTLGVTPEQLDVFFADSTLFEKADDKVLVDTVKNKLYADIIHFSTIVVKMNDAVTKVNDLSPVSEDVMKIYPNPLSNSATVQFSLAEAGNVNIEVYNLVGQRVQTITNRNFDKGMHKLVWSGDDMNGSPVTSGIYLCRFMKDGKVAQIEKMVVNR